MFLFMISPHLYKSKRSGLRSVIIFSNSEFWDIPSRYFEGLTPFLENSASVIFKMSSIEILLLLNNLKILLKFVDRSTITLVSSFIVIEDNALPHNLSFPKISTVFMINELEN